MTIATFTVTCDLSTYALAERGGGYGDLVVKASPGYMPVPADLTSLVQPDPVSIDTDGTASITLAAIPGVKYTISTSPRNLFTPFTFDALGAGETSDLSELMPVPATSPTTPYLIGRGVPAGGTTGQVAAKASDADYDVEWVDQTGGGGTATPDATSSVKGKIALAGDLGGTADLPTVPGLAAKADAAATTTALAGKSDTGHTHAYGTLSGLPTLGTAAATASTDYATAAQGVLAGTASQPGHTHAQADVTGLTTALAGKALNTVTITAGTGLTGGGDLTANRTLAVAYGTTSTTAAVGNDSRITGAAQKASNLSDLASASTARTNLGLGGAATLSVGTTAGTVAAGDHLHEATYVRVVNHGTTAGTARPVGATVVLWLGSVSPTNAISGDLWDQGTGVANYIQEPASDGTNGQVLTTNGAGVRTWTTVSGGGSDPWTYVVATADTSNNTTTAANIAGLSISGLANGLYEYKAMILATSASLTSGVQVTFNVPTGCTATLWMEHNNAGGPATGAVPLFATPVATAGAALPTHAVSLNAPVITGPFVAVIVTGVLRCSSMSGNLDVTVKSESGGGGAVAKTDSFVAYRKIAN